MKPSWVLSDEERDRRFRKTREKKRRKLQEDKDRTTGTEGGVPDPEQPRESSSPNQSARQGPYSYDVLKFLRIFGGPPLLSALGL